MEKPLNVSRQLNLFIEGGTRGRITANDGSMSGSVRSKARREVAVALSLYRSQHSHETVLSDNYSSNK